jgi:hypothetical protein
VALTDKLFLGAEIHTLENRSLGVVEIKLGERLLQASNYWCQGLNALS